MRRPLVLAAAAAAVLVGAGGASASSWINFSLAGIPQAPAVSRPGRDRPFEEPVLSRGVERAGAVGADLRLERLVPACARARADGAGARRRRRRQAEVDEPRAVRT